MITMYLTKNFFESGSNTIPHPPAGIYNQKLYLLHRREERLRERKGHAVFLTFYCRMV
jgi:hypothetical protein